METWNNGATEPTNTQLLEGVIEANDVFVIMNALAAPRIISSRDIESQVTWFNGNDVIVLTMTVSSSIRWVSLARIRARHLRWMGRGRNG